MHDNSENLAEVVWKKSSVDADVVMHWILSTPKVGVMWRGGEDEMFMMSSYTPPKVVMKWPYSGSYVFLNNA